MAARIPSVLRSAAFARPATAFTQTVAKRSFQTSQRMLQEIAPAPVRKPVGAFRGT